MLRSYFLLNVLLVTVIGILGARLHNVLNMSFDIPVKDMAVTQNNIKKKPVRKVDQADSSSFGVIASKNLFHPSRAMAQEPREVSSPVKKKIYPNYLEQLL